MKSTLQSIESFGPTPSFTVLPGSGEPYSVECDVLIACDGIKSKAHTDMLIKLNITADVEDNGQAAYRILLTREQLEHDPEPLQLLDNDRVTRWIGLKRSMIGYPNQNTQSTTFQLLNRISYLPKRRRQRIQRPDPSQP
jgi:salicylate hydroxylase